MRLTDLPGVPAGEGGHVAVTGFAIDSRKVAPGTVFGAFRGAVADGEAFIPQAVAAGAVAVIARPEAVVEGALHLADSNPRHAFAQAAAPFFAPYPPTIVAVTGTNGKTSTVELARQLWRMAGHHAASIGTLGITTADESVSTGLTTPDIVTFLANLGGLAREGVTHAAYEASSHGLSQFRSEGPRVAAAGFTNLSRDHLDYHGTMEAYLEAKLRLFTEVVAADGTAVVWSDDPASARVIELARERGLAVLDVGTEAQALRLVAREATALGQRLTLLWQGARHVVELPLIGAYQAANALVALGLVVATGGDFAATLGHIARVQPVRGRLERAAITRAGAPVYVDYAHTPDGLAAAIAALRPHTRGELVVVFGAGGDRDRGKRPEMGRIAAEQADLAIVTDDNPRGEDPAAIRAEIMAAATNALEIGDRRAAIARAIGQAGADDVVLVAGKGHEQGQIVGDRVLPFDDVQVVRECAG